MQEIFSILEQLPITKGIEQKSVISASKISMPAFAEYCRDQIILYPGQQSDALYVLCEGCAAAFSADQEKSILLRSFKPYEIFGVSNLFTNHAFATRIVAKTPCRILVLSRDFLSYLIDNDKNVRYQYISFLSNKTLYLNQKIACLTAGSAEKRLAFWLESQACNDVVNLDMPLTSLCNMLDMGRASLYRAFDQLESDGFIKRNGKTVTLYRCDDMLSFYH